MTFMTGDPLPAGEGPHDRVMPGDHASEQLLQLFQLDSDAYATIRDWTPAGPALSRWRRH